MKMVSIKQLRRDFPEWTWSAERTGLGWQYRGWQHGKQVVIYAVSVLCGPSEDDYSTQWHAQLTGCTTSSYASFWLDNQGGKEKA